MPHTHRDPLPAEAYVHCYNCNLTLAGIGAGHLIFTRDRSLIMATGVCSVRCHRCRANNLLTPESPTPGVTSTALGVPVPMLATDRRLPLPVAAAG